MTTFRDVIDTRARAQPDAPFLIAPEPGVTLTYADLARTSRAFAATMVANGVVPGEIVGFMLGNGVAAATVFLGAMYGGYIVSPINLLAQDAHARSHARALGARGSCSPRRSSSRGSRRSSRASAARRASCRRIPDDLAFDDDVRRERSRRSPPSRRRC